MADSGYILLPQAIDAEAKQLITDAGRKVVEAESVEKDVILPLLENAEAVVLRTGLKMDRRYIESAPSLKTISRTGAGYDNVDVDASTENGVIVTSSIGVNTETVVEHCLTLLLALYKQIFLMDREVRAGNFKVRYKNYPRDVKGKTLGIVGFGKIGSLFAEKCYRLFNMKVCAYDPFVTDELRNSYGDWVRFCSLEELFASSDIVSVHIPLNEHTRGLIGMELFAKMKRGSYIINASRGGTVKEEDLIKALEEGYLGGAGLDVFEKEPPGEDSPLLSMDSVILSPHSAALTSECVYEMAASAVRRVLAVLDGHVPENVINPEVLRLDRWSHLRAD